jgi:two-component system response regulator
VIPTTPSTPMRRILLVEDNEPSRDMLSRRLRRRGYTVYLAVDGREALDVAQQERPDLILMDMSLPVMDGWTAVRALRSDPSIAHIPVIALTAHAMAGDRERSLDAGCDDHESKPIEMPRLLSKIAMWTSREDA